jgi:hypothetical protein
MRHEFDNGLVLCRHSKLEIGPTAVATECFVRKGVHGLILRIAFFGWGLQNLEDVTHVEEFHCLGNILFALFTDLCVAHDSTDAGKFSDGDNHIGRQGLQLVLDLKVEALLRPTLAFIIIIIMY